VLDTRPIPLLIERGPRELDDGRRVRGRALTEPEQIGRRGEARYLFVGTGPLALFDWSLLDDV
jgi:hypothetical protein